MNRRSFIAGILGFLSSPLAATQQPSPGPSRKIYRIQVWEVKSDQAVIEAIRAYRRRVRTLRIVDPSDESIKDTIIRDQELT